MNMNIKKTFEMDITKEYKILLNELAQFNQELLFKPRLLAITKSDLIDEELKELLLPTIPKDIPYTFISSVTQQGLKKLKDMLWQELNKDFEEETISSAVNYYKQKNED